MKKLALAALAGLFVVTIVAVAVVVRDDATRDEAPPGHQGRLQAGLCAARHAAAGGEVGDSRRVFANRAHHALHELAATAGRHDRVGAARLLEAKEAVERDLAQSSPELVRDLERLISATARAGGHSGPATCPKREES